MAVRGKRRRDKMGEGGKETQTAGYKKVRHKDVMCRSEHGQDFTITSTEFSGT